MKQSSQIRRVPVRTMASRASVPVAVLSAGPLGRIRRKVRGQSLLLIALCMLLLVALVALAIDGGAIRIDDDSGSTLALLSADGVGGHRPRRA